MEGLTRLVSESFARHGFDRPLDHRRLDWSRWFPCESPRSLLLVPSKPGVFALAEEIMGFCDSKARLDLAGSTTTSGPRRMLAVLQFCEDDDMAFVLDRMFSRQNPMRARLASGRCFVRFVVLEDQPQRRSICNALNQWLISSSETTIGIGAHFATSLELTDQGVGQTLLSANAAAITPPVKTVESEPETSLALAVPEGAAPHLDSGAAKNIHCPSPFPSGF